MTRHKLIYSNCTNYIYRPEKLKRRKQHWIDSSPKRNVCFCRLAPPFFSHLHPNSSTWSPHYATVLYNTASYPDNWVPLPEWLCLNPKAVLGFALSPVAALWSECQWRVQTLLSNKTETKRSLWGQQTVSTTFISLRDWKMKLEMHLIS